MTDLHTHILPEMDDGSGSVEESLALLEQERQQGVETVFLTPHFYRRNETAMEFYHRRNAAYDRLRMKLPENAPALYLGAEIAWFPTVASEPLNLLTLGESSCFLLELPLTPWSSRLLDQLYELSCVTGLTPILAHVERYRAMQDKTQMAELLTMGFPMQMNADGLLRWQSRRGCKKLLQTGDWHLSSDCHNLKSRQPRMKAALRYLDADTLKNMTDWMPGKEESNASKP